jgi:hypothetical protein
VGLASAGPKIDMQNKMAIGTQDKKIKAGNVNNSSRSHQKPFGSRGSSSTLRTAMQSSASFVWNFSDTSRAPVMRQL